MAGLGEITSYGAAWERTEALSCLRAIASRLGADLARAEEIQDDDALAAIIGVDAWMFALQARDLDHTSRYGADAVGVLARLLARSAGGVRGGSAVEDDLPEAHSVHLLRAEQYATWLEERGAAAPRVLEIVAGDLAMGGGNDRLARMAGALLAVAGV